MTQLPFQFIPQYFFEFELVNLLKLVKIGLYLMFMIFYFVRVRSRKEEGSPVTFEILAGLFFLFMLLGSVWEVFMLVFDPIFFGYGFHTMQLIPTINIMGFPIFQTFTGEALVYMLGFIGLGLLCIGIEKGSDLKSKGAISVIPFALAGFTLISGLTVTYLPWFLLALSAAIVPILFFYIAAISEDEIRSKSLNIGFGYFFIFAGEAVNVHIVARIFPEWLDFMGYIVGIPFGFPINISFLMPAVSIIGCFLLLIGLVRFRD